MSFNKKEFLERVLEALEITINEYLEDMENDDNLNELINPSKEQKPVDTNPKRLHDVLEDTRFTNMLEEFNESRKENCNVPIQTINIAKLKPTIETILKHDPKGDNFIGTNFIVDIINLPEIEDQSTGEYTVDNAKISNLVKHYTRCITDVIEIHNGEFSDTPDYNFIKTCIQQILNIDDNTHGGYYTALKNAICRIRNEFYNCTSIDIFDLKYKNSEDFEGIKAEPVDTSKDQSNSQCELNKSDCRTTTYEFTNEELEDSYKKRVLPQINERHKDYALNDLKDKVYPEIITFINRLLKIAEDAAAAHTNVNSNSCSYVTKEHIGTLNKVLRCKAGKASFVYLIAYLRGMANGTENTPTTTANKEVARIVSEFLMNENLMIESELDASNPIEYVWYKMYKIFNLCDPEGC